MQYISVWSQLHALLLCMIKKVGSLWGQPISPTHFAGTPNLVFTCIVIGTGLSVRPMLNRPFSSEGWLVLHGLVAVLLTTRKHHHPTLTEAFPFILGWVIVMETGVGNETTSHSKTNLTYFSVMVKLNQVGQVTPKSLFFRMAAKLPPHLAPKLPPPIKMKLINTITLLKTHNRANIWKGKRKQDWIAWHYMPAWPVSPNVLRGKSLAPFIYFFLFAFKKIFTI